jgi:hypothetical protein
MPVNVEELTAEVSLVDGELPLTEAQVDHLASLVARRLAVRSREQAQLHEATSLRPGVAPPIGAEE